MINVNDFLVVSTILEGMAIIVLGVWIAYLNKRGEETERIAKNTNRLMMDHVTMVNVWTDTTNRRMKEYVTSSNIQSTKWVAKNNDLTLNNVSKLLNQYFMSINRDIESINNELVEGFQSTSSEIEKVKKHLKIDTKPLPVGKIRVKMKTKAK